MSSELKCVKCGTSKDITYEVQRAAVQIGGSKYRYYGWKRFRDYSATVPVCKRCKKQFDISGLTFICLMCGGLIAYIILLLSLVPMFFTSSVDPNVIYPLIIAIIFGCLMIILRFSKISSRRYIKFDRKLRTFAVKPKDSSRWVTLIEWMGRLEREAYRKEVEFKLIDYMKKNKGKAFSAQALLNRLVDIIENPKAQDYFKRNMTVILNELAFNDMIKRTREQEEMHYFL